MKVGVLRFPGSNCDQDCLLAAECVPGVTASAVWHKDASLAGFDAVMVPGGFSYGDYLRCGAIARFSPIMAAVRQFAEDGGPVLGICNGFQILCEAGLLPGALVRNKGLHFVCRRQFVRVETENSIFTARACKGDVLDLPVAHGEGCYFADATTLAELNKDDRVLLRYCDAAGATTSSSNPNGSLENIAGICNEGRNVFGLMPHPERACDPLLGGTDGLVILESLLRRPTL
jgi:phosphoribosylformylglycinamidine synthase subunit PurQ / glutaminase